MTHGGSTMRDVTVIRRSVEVYAEVRDAAPIIAGRYELDAFRITVIYRCDVPDSAWQFVHVTVNGIWLNGGQVGKSGLRRYGRNSLNRVPDWLVQFISEHNPESEKTYT